MGSWKNKALFCLGALLQSQLPPPPHSPVFQPSQTEPQGASFSLCFVSPLWLLGVCQLFFITPRLSLSSFLGFFFLNLDNIPFLIQNKPFIKDKEPESEICPNRQQDPSCFPIIPRLAWPGLVDYGEEQIRASVKSRAGGLVWLIMISNALPFLSTGF